MKNPFEVKCEREESGKMRISMRRNTSSILRSSTLNQFKFNRENIFLYELKTGNHLRAFGLSIRLDGHKENEGEILLSQISLSTVDLIELRDQIDNLLNGR